MENREIKFRAWDKYQKKMLDWADITDPMKLTLSNLLNGLIEHLKPMQYIGLKDKNGKEIYGGDIIECITKQHGWPHRGIVEYTEPSFRINVGKEPGVHDDEDGGPDYHTDFYNNENFEIIGNLYENPELIKQLNEA